MSRPIVTYNSLGRYGRFANGLFQIASTIGIARKNGFDFAFPPWFNYDHKDRFGSTEDIDLQKYFVNPLPVYNGPMLPDHFIHWGYHDVRLTKSTSLSGHMQSARYFDHCLDEVRWYFKMKDEIKQDYYQCAIHVRLGDYDGAYHPRLDKRYYLNAVKVFEPGTCFLVLSDDIEAADSMIGEIFEETDRVYKFGFSTEDYLADFRIMKSCRHFIIGNSSYSAFAAILGEAEDKVVVAPDPWFGPKYTNITGKDIYCEDWKIINWEKQLT
jgi:hypothetical protein